jgi:hypothetical protein
VANLIATWTINGVRIWPGPNACCCGQCSMIPSRGLFLDALATSTALASQMLLVAV